MASKILVVDDEASIATTVTLILNAHGYVAEGVCSGKEAIVKARTMLPDVLLSDVLMPGLNGFETALEVKQACPDCRLLFFSAYPATECVQHFRKVFADRGYRLNLLAKPVAPAMLLRSVEKAIHEA